MTLIRTGARLDDILHVCHNLVQLLHFATNSTSNLADLDPRKKLKHLNHLETTTNLDLSGFNKLFCLCPNLQHLAIGPKDSSPSYRSGEVAIKPSQFLESIQKR